MPEVFGAEPTDVPASLVVVPGDHLILQAHGVGDQIYTCKATAEGKFSWTLKAPDARLLDETGKQVGRHFAGPTWEAADGSQVQAKPAASTPAPDPQSVPWLLLNVTSHEGQGKMTAVTQVQRLHTKGGKAPANDCAETHATTELRVPYEADYYFYSAAGQ